MENWGCVTYGDSAALPHSPPAQPAGRAGRVRAARDGPHVVRRPGDHAAGGTTCGSTRRSRPGPPTGPWRRPPSSPTSGRASWRSTSARPTRWTWARRTHPIRGEVADVNGAMANFDAITYVKGQSVLQQLMAYIGEDAFVEGLRAYFRDHAFGNTVLDDLMSAFAAAAGRDLSDWTAAWLDRSGTDVLALRRLDRPRRVPRRRGAATAPARHRLLLGRTATRCARSGRRLDRARPGRTTEVELPAGDLHLLNADDLHLRGRPTRPRVAAADARPPRRLPRPAVTGAGRGHDQPALLLGRALAAPVLGAISRRAPHRTQPRAGRALPLRRPSRRRPLGPAHRVRAGAQLSRWPTPRRCSPTTRPTASPPCARWPRSATTDEHWAAAGGGAAAARPRPGLADARPPRRARPRDDDAVEPPAGARRRPRRRGQARSRCSPPVPTRRPRRAVWRAFFVDYVGAGQSRHPRARRDLLAPEPGRAAGAVHAPLPRGAAQPQGRHAQPGRRDPGDVPARRGRPVVPDRGHGRERGRDRSARTPATSCAAQSFVLGRLHQAREL